MGPLWWSVGHRKHLTAQVHAHNPQPPLSQSRPATPCIHTHYKAYTRKHTRPPSQPDVDTLTESHNHPRHPLAAGKRATEALLTLPSQRTLCQMQLQPFDDLLPRHRIRHCSMHASSRVHTHSETKQSDRDTEHRATSTNAGPTRPQPRAHSTGTDKGP